MEVEEEYSSLDLNADIMITSIVCFVFLYFDTIIFRTPLSLGYKLLGLPGWLLVGRCYSLSGICQVS